MRTDTASRSIGNALVNYYSLIILFPNHICQHILFILPAVFCWSAPPARAASGPRTYAPHQLFKYQETKEKRHLREYITGSLPLSQAFSRRSPWVGRGRCCCWSAFGAPASPLETNVDSCGIAIQCSILLDLGI